MSILIDFKKDIIERWKSKDVKIPTLNVKFIQSLQTVNNTIEKERIKMNISEIDAEIGRLLKEKDAQQKEIDKKLEKEKEGRRKEVSEAWNRYLELNEKYNKDYPTKEITFRYPSNYYDYFTSLTNHIGDLF